MITLTQVKKTGEELTGLKIMANEYQNTCLGWNIKKAEYININKKQLLNIYKDKWDFLYKRFGITKNGIILQALLHEIAHYKQYQKIGGCNWGEKYNKNPNYYEKVANRYSTKYYKVVKNNIEGEKYVTIP